MQAYIIGLLMWRFIIVFLVRYMHMTNIYLSFTMKRFEIFPHLNIILFNMLNIFVLKENVLVDF